MVNKMIELVDFSPSGIVNQYDIVEAIRRMHKKNMFANVIVMNLTMFNKINKLPGYSSEILYGKKVINNECGKIEGLVVVISEEYKDKVYVADLPLNL